MLLAIAFAAAVATMPAPADSAAPADGANRVVCRNSTYTGSRLGATKVCRTKAEWNEIQAEHDRLLRQQQQAHGLNSGA